MAAFVHGPRKEPLVWPSAGVLPLARQRRLAVPGLVPLNPSRSRRRVQGWVLMRAAHGHRARWQLLRASDQSRPETEPELDPTLPPVGDGIEVPAAGGRGDGSTDGGRCRARCRQGRRYAVGERQRWILYRPPLLSAPPPPLPAGGRGQAPLGRVPWTLVAEQGRQHGTHGGGGRVRGGREVKGGARCANAKEGPVRRLRCEGICAHSTRSAEYEEMPQTWCGGVWQPPRCPYSSACRAVRHWAARATDAPAT